MREGSKSKKLQSLSDLTIKDFADCQNGTKGRLRKNRPFVTEIVEEDSMEGDGESRQKNRRRTKGKDAVDENHVYNDYHIDIWYLIANYIKPEDVGRFALICKKTDLVVASAKFWLNMYKVYYSPFCELPPRLSPSSIKRLGGLRASVIRSLFYFYKPFIERLKVPIDFNSITKQACVGVWSTRTSKDHWNFYYRFRRKIQSRSKVFGVLRAEQNRKLSFIERLNDIFDNPDECYNLLVINTPHYVPMPNLFGESEIFLSSITQPLSQNLRTYKLEMKFANYKNELVTTISYDPVAHATVYPWWHPEYQTHLS